MLPFPIKGGKLYLYNNNPLLMYGYPDTTGLKTGYTEAAGTCLVGTARRDGVELGVVLLNSPAPGTQAAKLLDEGFNEVYRLRPIRRRRPFPAAHDRGLPRSRYPSREHETGRAAKGGFDGPR